MTVIIALLRGVNVGGHNKIKMEDLREICASLKLLDVRTYVQSGNIVFKTAETDLLKLSRRIEDAIEHDQGFRPSVICRTAAEMKAVAARNPFAKRADLDPSRLAVCFLACEPSNLARARLLQIKAEPEELRIGRNELFIYFPNGMARPKLSMPAVERAVGTPMTSRNWNTVTKLLEMAEEIDRAFTVAVR
jgi:uncharacterized protein (DUF1697 family)